jgi:hypothetical protein
MRQPERGDGGADAGRSVMKQGVVAHREPDGGNYVATRFASGMRCGNLVAMTVTVRVMGPAREIRPDELWPAARNGERRNRIEWVDPETGDLRPPSAHVELYVAEPDSDLGSTLWIGYDGDGDGLALSEMPAERAARTVRWEIPRLVASTQMYETLATIAPQAGRVAEGLTVEGGRQRLTAGAQAAYAEFERRLWELFGDWPVVELMDIESFETPIDLATLHTMVGADTTDDELLAMIETLRSQLEPSERGNYVVLDRAGERLSSIRDRDRATLREKLKAAASLANGDRAERDRLVRRIASWGVDSDRKIGSLAGLSHSAVQKIAAKPTTTAPDNVVPIAPGVVIRQVDVSGSWEKWDVSADSEGSIFIAIGRWLNERHGTAEERTVEAVSWEITDAAELVLHLTVTRQESAAL